MKHTLDTIPVIPVEQAGHSFLVAPYGEVQWIRNLRAAGTAMKGAVS